MFRIALILSLPFVVSSCGFLKEPGTPLAKVKDQTLTLEEVQSQGTVARDSAMERVEEWVSQQVLLQEALSQGVQNEPEVKWLLRDAERKIILDAFLRKFEKSLTEPEEGELELYFEKHKESFVRGEPAYQFQTRKFADMAGAKNALHVADSLFASDSGSWANSNEMGSCFRGILATLRPNSVSIPQLCGDSIVVLKLIRMKSVGEALTYQDARDNLLKLVREEHRRQKMDSLLVDAKTRQAVFTWPENLPPK